MPKNIPDQLQQQIDRLAPLIKDAQANLRLIDPDVLIERGGCSLDAAGNYHLDFFDQAYVIAKEDFSVKPADSDQQAMSLTQGLILTYLSIADGTYPTDRWIGFRELPSGLFYAQAFQGYTGDRLVREMHGDLEMFRHAAQALKGEALSIGNVSYAFKVLPRLRLVVVMWAGDDEFPSQARVLFEASAPHYMPTEGLAILGSHLISRIVKAAR